jgi:hypothetical protein
VEDRQPAGRIVADLGPNAIEKLDGFRASGEHGQRVVEAGEIEFRYDRVMALF